MKNPMPYIDAALLKVPTKVFTIVAITAAVAFVGYTGYVIFDLQAANNRLVTRLDAAKHGDLDGDGEIDINDASILSANWSGAKVAPPKQGDLNGDGKVDGLDLSTLLSNWSDPTEKAPNAQQVSPKPIFQTTAVYREL